MSQQDPLKSVQRPAVPFGSKMGNMQDEYWGQKVNSGALGAFRQLNKSKLKGGRKQAALPGGKLQPLFKNNTAPPRLERGLGAFGGNALPNIAASPAAVDGAGQVKHIMIGNTDNLSSEVKSTVRIYLASNSVDMDIERNLIFQKAVPELQDFCSSHGLLFQLVDLNYKAPPDVTEKSQENRGIRMREIAECQQLSLGPSFIALLGDSYGQIQIPREIPEEEYTLFRSIAVDQKLQHIELLDQYYCKDESCVPTKYILKDVTENSEHLSTFLQNCAKRASEAGKLDENRLEEYMSSVMSDDIRHGLLKMNNPRHHCLAFKREFQHIKKHRKTPGVSQFCDFDKSGDLADDLYQLNQELTNDVSSILGVSNCKQYYLQWEEKGLANPANDPEYKKYLDRFLDDFVSCTKDLIIQSVQKYKRGSKKVEKDTMQEVLHHSKLANEHSHHFHGQESLLHKVEIFLRDPRRNNKPFVIYGPSGCGKTSCVAELTKRIKKWIGPDSVVVARFLGSTTDSSNIYMTVRNITLQICLAYNIDLPDNHSSFKTLHTALSTFRRVISKASQEHAFVKPLYILLDGINHLHPHEDSLKALWAIKDLPPNVHIIMTTLPELGKIKLLSALLSLVTTESESCEVEKLTDDEVKKVIDSFLTEHKRKLVPAHEAKLIETYKTTNQPLHLKILLQESLKYNAFTDAKDVLFSSDPQSYLDSRLEALEDKFGVDLVMMLASYITASPCGIHEQELIDLLSTNPDILEEIRGPDVDPSTEVTVAPFTISSVLHALEDALTRNFAHGKKVLAWKHQEFYDAIGKQYSTIYTGMDESLINEDGTSATLLLHEQMANYYLPDKRSFMLNDDYDTVNAHVHPQPLIPQNAMKLHKVLSHLKVLIPVESLDRAFSSVLFNYDWLLTKLQVVPLYVVINDILTLNNLTMHLYSQKIIEDKTDIIQMDALHEFLQLAEPALIKNPHNLSIEIMGRLPKLTDKIKCFKNLVEGVEKATESTESKHLVPIYPCLQEPCGLLRHTLEGPTHVVGFLQGGQVGVMFSQTSGVDIWSMATGQLLHRFSVNKEQRVTGIIPAKTYEFVIIGHYSHLNHVMELGGWSSETGVQLVQSNFPQKFESFTLDDTDTMMIVSTTVEKPGSSAMQRCIMGVNLMTKDVSHMIPLEKVHSEGIKEMTFLRNVGGNEESVVTLGERKSKDIVLWNLDSDIQQYKIDLSHEVDIFRVFKSDRETFALCGSLSAASLTYVDLVSGTVKHTLDNSKFAAMVDIVVTDTGKHAIVSTKKDDILVVSIDDGSCFIAKTIEVPIKSDSTLISPSAIMVSGIDNGHFIYVGYENGTVKIISSATGQIVLSLNHHTKRVNSLTLCENGKLLTGADDQKVHLFNIEKELEEYRLRAGQTVKQWDGVNQFNSATEKVSEVTTAEEEFPSQKMKVSSYFISSDGAQIVTGLEKGGIKIWDVESGKLERNIESGCEDGMDLLYSGYKGKLIIGHVNVKGNGRAKCLRVWTLSNGNQQKFEGDNDILVYCSILYPSGERVLTISPSDENKHSGIVLGIYDLFEMKNLKTLHCNIYGTMDYTNLRFIGFTKQPPPPPKKRTFTDDDDVKTDDSRAREKPEVGEEEVETNLYAVLDYFPHENVSYFFSFTISGKNQDEITMESNDPTHIDTTGPHSSATISGGVCVSGNVNGVLVAWDVQNQKILGSYKHKETINSHVVDRPAHNGAISFVSVSDDRQMLASGGMDGHVHLWNLLKGKLITSFDCHTDKISHLSFTNDDKLLLSGSTDHTMSVIDVRAGQVVASFYGHAPVRDVTMVTEKKRVVVQLEKDVKNVAVLKAVNL